MPITIIHIKGMTCGGCVSSVKTVLTKIPGVSNAEVSLDDGQAVVQHDGSHEDMIFSRAIEDAGFEVIRQ
ncbi:heavy-metal-associated domain-containing protein [Nitrosomonas sp. HPC101]|uniref:heavy-metal-associated domain-containing protein n=1 Tax=Nitrosomonas sp. HPC101 TaxID=1658667 RepID=UPI001369B536|nr:heavy metal-associated domain-containing protein [Nitrosomonas sp. HPC101]MXS84858.1 heavy-metal-associated domain-containing protein [Nitrosomonas sp. HPC101]